MGGARSEMCWGDQQAGNSCKSSYCNLEYKGSLEAELVHIQVFSHKSSTDWIRPTHIMGGNLLYSISY